MNKKILYILVAAMLAIAPQTLMAQDVKQEPAKTTVEPELNPVTITVNESSVQIKNACQMTLEVFNLAGVKVATVKIDSDSKSLTFNDLPKGCYILKVGKVVRKVYLK